MKIELLLDFLSEEGFRPKLDEDQDIVFKCEGRNFLCFPSEKDEKFFQLVMPFIFEVSEDNREMVLDVCNEVTRGMKVAKCVITDAEESSVWLLYETYVDDPSNLGEVFSRALSTLFTAYQEFTDNIQE